MTSLTSDDRFAAESTRSRWDAAAVLRWLGIGLCAAFALSWLGVGTNESRTFYLLTFLLGFANPVWALYALALIGPMALLDAGKTHMLLGLDTLVAGALAGELRLSGRGLASRRAIVHWGLWPHFLIGLFAVLCASALIGLQLVWLRETFWEGTSPLFHRVAQMFTGPATEPEWALRSLWNWGSAMLLAVVAARRFDELALARWLKIAAISLTVACLLGLLDWAAINHPGWTRFSLRHLRAPNPDPVQIGRLQGTAGHPGWFAQWIVLAWPGLLLWWSEGRTKRNFVIIGAIGVAMLALLLSAARAGWLAVMITVPLGVGFILRHNPAARKSIPWVVGAVVVAAVIALTIGGSPVWNRLENLMRFSDRTNYWSTGLVLLREFPFGIGLGTHYRFYGWMIPPDYRWGQVDYVDSHNFLLHLTIENGPFVPLLIVAGLVGLYLEIRRSWGMLGFEAKRIVGALSLSLIGILIVGVAQYIPYLRIIEISTWILAGSLVGVCRRQRALTAQPLDSPRGQRVLLICGVLAAITASMNAHRVYVGEVPRTRDVDEQEQLSIWTARRWRVAVERDVDEISFSLLRKAVPTTGRIIWPDGTIESFEMTPSPTDKPLHEREAWRYFSHTLTPQPASWHDAPLWLEIEIDRPWRPVDFIPGATDTRELGVYISGLQIESEWRRALWAERAAIAEKRKAEAAASGGN